MNKNPLVSVITPCYNAENKIVMYLESLLSQTYRNLELIFINDGSTDSTEDIILSYKIKFEALGMKFIYLYQKNSGQDVAMNAGLKIFTGKYLIWSDNDDILLPNNIFSKVRLMENNKKLGIVYCNAYIAKSNNIQLPIKKWKKPLMTDKMELFYDVLTANNVLFPGGVWMIRSESFFKIYPDRQINIYGFGQNWQMLLPMIYYFEVGKVEEYLFVYVLYDNSYSANKRNQYEVAKNYILKQKEALYDILNSLKVPLQKKKKLDRLINTFIFKNLLFNAILFNNRDEYKSIYKKGKLYIKYFNLIDKIKIYLYKYILYNYIKR